jgi:hypothetical protein
MRAWKRLYLAAALVVGYVAVSDACGPFFPEAVFVSRSGPDGSYARYAKGTIGVPQPGYAMRHLVIAYDWLNGHGLSAAEQQEVVAHEADLNPPQQTYPAPPPRSEPAPAKWADARKASGVSEQDTAPANEASAGKTAAQVAAAQIASARMQDDLEEFAAERPVPGQQYSYFTNCLDDAFTTAVETMAARKSAHGGDGADFAEWVHGQDAVFRNCNGQAVVMPAPVGVGTPVWLREDRAYQRAAASFYQLDYDRAIVQFRAIAADGASPWNRTARLVMARSMIRRALVGQITDMDPGGRRPSVQYDPKLNALAAAYEKTLTAKRPERLQEAEVALAGIVDDPMMAEFHHSAAGLLDLVRLKADPAQQALVLEQRLTGVNRAQTPGVFRQALIDLSYFPDGALPEVPGERATAEPLTPDVLGWIRVMEMAKAPEPELGFVDNEQVVPGPEELVQANQEALSAWHSTHETAWLIASLTAARPGDAALPELLAAAASLPSGSPGAVAATYYRLRFAGDSAAARVELGHLLPTLTRTESRSTANLFRMLQQRSAPTLSAFLENAGLLPAAETDDDDEDDTQLGTKVQDGLCHLRSSDADTMLFDHDAATVLNTRMPLRMMAEAAEDAKLPPNLRFQIAQATWTRAVLLTRPAVARQMGPILSGCYPAWQPVLTKYDAAGNVTDREAEGLLALMRFASTEPIIRDGEQRPDGFATYSAYRDNWWQGSQTEATSGGSLYAGSFFGTEPASVAELPNPPFLIGLDNTEAAGEVTALRTVPCASDYFAATALKWQEQHPDDTRTPDILGFAERVVRSGCQTEATKELNHQLFVVMQTKYPKSEWASKYRTWE